MHDRTGYVALLSMRLSSHLIQSLPVRAAVAVRCGIKFAVSMHVQLLARNLIKRGVCHAVRECQSLSVECT